MHYGCKRIRTVMEAPYTDILQHIAHRDSKAVEQLYERYGRQLHQYALTHWKMDEDAVWDVLYQTLDQLIARLPTYSFLDQQAFNRFVFKVFLNFLRQRYRKDHNPNRYMTVPLTERDEAGLADEADDTRQDLVADWLANSQKEFYEQDESDSLALSQLRQALHQLDPVDRDLLLLRAQGFSYDEIARMLGLTGKQLKVKHLRAKHKLIKLIDHSL